MGISGSASSAEGRLIDLERWIDAPGPRWLARTELMLRRVQEELDVGDQRAEVIRIAALAERELTALARFDDIDGERARRWLHGSTSRGDANFFACIAPEPLPLRRWKTYHLHWARFERPVSHEVHTTSVGTRLGVKERIRLRLRHH